MEEGFIKGILEGDPITRYAYADWLEEQGRTRSAALQRWMATYKKCPRPSPPEGAGTVLITWDWWNGNRETLMDETKHADLPNDIFRALSKHNMIGPEARDLRRVWLEYRTREDAENALLDALLDLGIIA